MTALVGELAPGASDVVKMPITIPDEAFSSNYVNTYIAVQNAEGIVLSNVELFEVKLEFPYKIVINDDDNLETITMKEGETLVGVPAKPIRFTKIEADSYN